MTPAELGDLASGYQWRWERQRELAAWVVSYLLAPHSKHGRGPSIDALLGRQDQEVITLPNGLTVSGDARLAAMLVEELMGQPARGDEQGDKFEQLWAKVQAGEGGPA